MTEELKILIGFIPSIIVALMWLWSRFMEDTRFRQDKFCRPMKSDLVWEYYHRTQGAHEFDWAPSYYVHVWNMRDGYYEALGMYWYPDCKIPDWRVAEVAIGCGMEPELALIDAHDKGFL